MATKRTLLKDLKVIRKNEKKEEIKQACIEVLFSTTSNTQRVQVTNRKKF